MPVLQILTLELDGLTAADYLAHVRDPEPPALDGRLASLDVHARDPLGDAVVAVLAWRDDEPPAADAAARAAGLVRTAEVVALQEVRVTGAVAAAACPEQALAA